MLVVERAADGVIPCAQLHPGNIPHVSDPACGIGSDNDVAKLFFVLETAMDVHDQLECGWRGDRLGPDDAAGHLNVLLANGVHDVAGHQPAAGELCRIEPDAHGIVAGAEDRRLTHPGCARPSFNGVRQLRRYSASPAVGENRLMPIMKSGDVLTVVAQCANNVWEPWRRLVTPDSAPVPARCRDCADLDGHRERGFPT